MNNQPTNQDLMDAIVGLGGDVVGMRGEVGGLKADVGGLKGEVGCLTNEVGGLKGEIGGLRIEFKDMITEGVGNALEQMVFPRFVEMEDRFDRIEARLSQTVTLDQLDRKLTSLKDELKDTGAKAIRKVTHLAQILHSNNVLSAAQVVEVGRA